MRKYQRGFTLAEAALTTVLLLTVLALTAKAVSLQAQSAAVEQAAIATGVEASLIHDALTDYLNEEVTSGSDVVPRYETFSAGSLVTTTVNALVSAGHLPTGFANRPTSPLAPIGAPYVIASIRDSATPTVVRSIIMTNHGLNIATSQRLGWGSGGEVHTNHQGFTFRTIREAQSKGVRSVGMLPRTTQTSTGGTAGTRDISAFTGTQPYDAFVAFHGWPEDGQDPTCGPGQVICDININPFGDYTSCALIRPWITYDDSPNFNNWWTHGINPTCEDRFYTDEIVAFNICPSGIIPAPEIGAAITGGRVVVRNRSVEMINDPLGGASPHYNPDKYFNVYCNPQDSSNCTSRFDTQEWGIVTVNNVEQDRILCSNTEYYTSGSSSIHQRRKTAGGGLEFKLCCR